MANKDWQRNFQQRCEDVGWRVERSGSDHMKVYDGSKLLFTYSGTPGDKRTMMNVLSQAKRAGLLELESDRKLERERDRLERIEVDRLKNGHSETAFTAALAAAVAKTAVTNAVSVETAAAVATSEDLGDVDGVAVVAVAPAKIKTPVMSEAAPIAGGQELLLADDRVVYRCVRDAAMPHKPELTGTCNKTFDRIGGLQTHITFHSRTTLPRTPRQREAIEAAVKTAARKAVTAARAAQTEKIEEVAVTAATTAPAASRPEIASRVTELSLTVDKMLTGMQDVARELVEIRDSLQRLPVADEETLRKAAQFDNLRAMLS